MSCSRRNFIRALTVAPLAGGALFTTGSASAASSREYPAQPIKFVVPFSPGSSTDIAGRQWAEVVGKAFNGANVIVENRAGAGGTIGALSVVRAPSDGYTLLYSTATTWAIAPFIYPDLAYQPKRDLVPIAVTTSVPVFLVVAGDSDIKDFKDLTARVKARPDQYNYGSNGVGAHSHITCQLLANRMGAPGLLHVPFKQGSQGVMSEVIAGRLTFAVDAWSVVGPLIQSGRLKVLAAISKSRLAVAPDTPTIAEILGTDFDTMTWSGLWAPKGTDPQIIKKIHDAVMAGFDDDALVKQYERQGTPLMPRMSLEEVNRFMDSEVDRWRMFVAEANIQP